MNRKQERQRIILAIGVTLTTRGFIQYCILESVISGTQYILTRFHSVLFTTKDTVLLARDVQLLNSLIFPPGSRTLKILLNGVDEGRIKRQSWQS